jgi:hypothetical protein
MRYRLLGRAGAVLITAAPIRKFNRKTPEHCIASVKSTTLRLPQDLGFLRHDYGHCGRRNRMAPPLQLYRHNLE